MNYSKIGTVIILAIFLIIIIGSIIIIMLIPMSSNKIKRFLEDIYGDNEVGDTVCEHGAKIIEKKVRRLRQMPDYNILCICFEFSDGRLAEFALKNKGLYDSFNVGDAGSLYYIGNRFKYFKINRSR